MDKNLHEKMEQKIKETLDDSDELLNLLRSLNVLSDNSNSFSYGVVIGRLYNSFYYQCRRLLKRNPTEKEFSEFLSILKKHEQEFIEKINFD